MLVGNVFCASLAKSRFQIVEAATSKKIRLWPRRPHGSRWRNLRRSVRPS